MIHQDYLTAALDNLILLELSWLYFQCRFEFVMNLIYLKAIVRNQGFSHGTKQKIVVKLFLY